MARARVQLIQGLSYDAGAGKVWRKGQPEILTNEKEIARYKANARFSVTMLKEPARQKAAAKDAAPAAASPSSGGSGRQRGGRRSASSGGDD